MRLGHVQLAILMEHMKCEERVTTFDLGRRFDQFISTSEFKSSVKRLRALGLLESHSSGMSHRLTPKGLFEYLRNGGGTLDHEGRNFFRDFLERNSDLLGSLGEEESEYIEKCLVLGFAPRFSKKQSPSGT